ncbi:RNA polymerase sigma factor [Streptomyces sp. NPDC001435]|uniref:RNA polymerase sigma factor n=1 Tax=Streptomyces sp. NPDC001435 TaxID=3364576 RepID=UPI00367DCDDE
MDRAAVGVLVEAAADGDKAAWDALVKEFSPLVWAVVRGHGLSDADCEEVYLEVWFRFVVTLKDFPEPEEAGVWFAGTARQESLEALKSPRRDDPRLRDHKTGDRVPEEARPGSASSAAEADRIRTLWEEFEQLGPRCRQLLRILMTSPPPSYAEVSAATGLAVGSIGPMRQRCLRRLRARVDARWDSVAGRNGGSGAVDSGQSARPSGCPHGPETVTQDPIDVMTGGTAHPSPVTDGDGVFADPSALPGCQVHLTLLDEVARAGASVRLAVQLVAEAAHPWARPGARPTLDVVAKPMSAAEVVPATMSYGSGTVDSVQFRVTAAESGTHRIRFTFLHHDTGIVLQQVETDLDIAPREPTGSGKPWLRPRRGRS